jgi:hypothetical protein
MNPKAKAISCAALLMMVGCSAPSAARGARIVTYKCAGGRTFTVKRDADRATVNYGEQSYDLSRRKSSLGTRYSANGASLIVDDDVAVFVTERVLDLRVCREAQA